jgi:hypothetical protein
MSAIEANHLVVIWDPNRARPVFIDRDLKQSLTAKTGMPVRVPFSPQDISTPAYLPTNNSAPVAPLQPAMVLPAPLVQSWTGGSTEEYAAKLGWRYTETTPAGLSASYLLDMKKGGLAGFHIILGGLPIVAAFPFAKMFGLEGRTSGAPEDLINVTINPANIIFAGNKMVSAWGPIMEVFRGSLSHAGVNHDWKTGPGVYVRYDTQPGFVKQRLTLLLQVPSAAHSHPYQSRSWAQARPGGGFP